MKIGIILLLGEKQNECFWPSYYKCIPGIPHDIILVHRNNLGLIHEPYNKQGNIFFENKIINNKDLPHRDFGAYRYFYEKYKNNYSHFVFISDDVILKRDFWLKSIYKCLELHPKVGFGGTQIFNKGINKYPHESHIRAPFWYAKTEVLKKIKWEFNDAHDGEMKIGLQCAEMDYIGVQCGNKINLGFDALEPYHITQIIEKKYFNHLHPYGKHKIFNYFEKNINSLLNETIQSPYSWINTKKLLYDIEPFNNLIFEPTIKIAKKYNICHEIIEGVFVLNKKII